MEEHKILRDAIKYENELINNRLTWLGTLEGLLFATLGLAYDKIKPNFYLISVISLLGALIAVSCWIGTLRANKVINYYEKKQEEFPGDLLSQDVVKTTRVIFIG